jgi:hypothetical protein
MPRKIFLVALYPDYKGLYSLLASHIAIYLSFFFRIEIKSTIGTASNSNGSLLSCEYLKEKINKEPPAIMANTNRTI